MVSTGTANPGKREGIFPSQGILIRQEKSGILLKILENKEFNQLKILGENENVYWLLVHKYFLASLCSAYLPYLFESWFPLGLENRQNLEK